MSSKDVRDSFYFGSPAKKVFAGAELKTRLGQLEAMKSFYGARGNSDEVARYEKEISELSGATA